jgi:dTDP-4-dehydrorhamnose 3,5-epimerase
MQFIPTSIPDVIQIEPKIFQDNRGFFLETYQAQVFKQAGINTTFVQDNLSGSSRGTLRGLHYQIKQTQAKLVRVAAGEVFDVAVDLRRSSPTFGQWTAVRLSSENKRQVYIPGGFAHGFYVLSDWAEVCYKASDFYAPDYERTLLWNDPQLGIKWPIVDRAEPVISPKDAQGTPLREAQVYE